MTDHIETERCLTCGALPTVDCGHRGPCWMCGEATTVQCDYEYRHQPREQQCRRQLCRDHAVCEAQLGDVHGSDGVDVRCAEHAAPAGTVEVLSGVAQGHRES
jgi:hypothetical protein